MPVIKNPKNGQFISPLTKEDKIDLIRKCREGMKQNDFVTLCVTKWGVTYPAASTWYYQIKNGAKSWYK